MNIEIVQIIDTENSLVRFTSPAGSASGVWCGEQKPQLGNYNVEFEIPDEVQCWTLAQASCGAIEDAGDRPGVSVTGMVERVDEDSVVTLRIQSDVLLIETPKNARMATPGTYLNFTAPFLELYPYQL
ncbi:hypothetical protein LKL35_27615 [Streptomyces sp. ET3-23]|uniref:hypothetical protein n=1 Tax=Streptomyces sp. ET3-23 TaxID=2885643 RepID=UPI001D0FD214|nr:hypothetical protein [Streptomyces sp. ET3-23]MCC2279167.1 hypothetical protein [Streptomyces sp. ET3-23]